jgi:hypothetical protein
MKIPVALNIPPLPPPINRNRYAPLVPSAASSRSTPLARNGVGPTGTGGFYDKRSLPGDRAWIIEREYGFLGEVRPLAYGINDALVEVEGFNML